MSDQTLVILPYEPSFIRERKILGFSVLDRILIPARKSGFELSSSLAGQMLLIRPNFIFSMEFWWRLGGTVLDPNTALVSEACPSFMLVRTYDRALIESIRSAQNPHALFEELKSKLKIETITLSPKDWVQVETEKDLAIAQTWLLQGLIKDSEGFMSKHLERKISILITSLLVRTPMTPNLMTLVSTVIGIIGGLFFLWFYPSWQNILGALLFWLHSVLDGCDGEMARLKYMESRMGGLLDFWGDNIVHSVVFYCIAVSRAMNYASTRAMGLGVLAIAGTLGSAAVVYWTTMRKKKSQGPLFTSVVETPDRKDSSARRFIDFLARRDFIYLVILLSIFGKIHWFLWMGAAGAPIYFIILIFLNLREDKTS